VKRSGSAPASVWMGSGRSGAAPGGIFPQYVGSLRPSEFEGRSRSTPVSALTSPPVSLVSAPEVPNLVSMAELPGLAHSRRRSPARTPVAGGASTLAVGGARPPVALPAARDPAWDEVEEDADMWDPLNSTLYDMWDSLTV
jgi:hypothetical protein